MKLLAAAAFITSLLIFCDARPVAWFGWFATLALLVAIAVTRRSPARKLVSRSG